MDFKRRMADCASAETFLDDAVQRGAIVKERECCFVLPDGAKVSAAGALRYLDYSGRIG